MIVLDLFSGAGGLSEGFLRVGSTFVGHVEVDSYACKTLKTRTAYWNLKKENKLEIYNKYLLGAISTKELWELSNITNSEDVINEAISDKTFPKIIKTINKNLKLKNIKKVDVIIGGPPCQAYSVIGRARMKDAVVNDPRNFLYKYYVKFLEKYKPKMFIFENVMGLKTAGNGEYYRSLKKALDKAGYHIEENIMYANDYGVLQSRKRIIIVGWKKDKRRKNYPFPEFEKIKLDYDITVNDVLKDLPITYPGNKIEGKDLYAKETNKYLKFANIRSDDFNILTQHETRPHNEIDREIYREAITAWNNNKERLNYSELAERRPDLITHKNTKTFTNRFNVIKADEKASHTILAHIAMDGHYYIHPDIKQLRSLSIREAARLQSFPDDFYFEGPRTSIFRQIGNAVPPKMAEQIAKKIKDLI
ncbi:DNA cytosine methyltransferase [Malaciobacter marinus]|uniref:DNA cytosine methyltransferase n=1 Tax=Malaciobacter marinus TaxID=505249 RepID=UPI003B00AFF5